MFFRHNYDAAQQYIHPNSVRHDFYISEVIGEASDYTDMIQTLHQATNHDVIYIHINSPGGNFYTSCQIVEAIETTNAQGVICCAEGLVGSAATMIFLAAQSWIVSKYSTFMFHTSSGGEHGKHPDTKKSVLAHEEHLNRVSRFIYEDFFTEEEIDEIINGNKDCWLTPAEVGQRLDKVTEKADSRMNEMEDKMKKAEEICREAGLDINLVRK